MKSVISWKLQESGVVVGPRIHDAQMTSYAYSYKDRFSFEVCRESGELVLIEFSGVHELQIEMWEGAIVFEISVWRVNAVPEQNWGIPDAGWNALYKNRSHDLAGIKKHATATIQKLPDFYLAQISFSYGGDIVAVCKDIVFYEVGSR